MITGKAAVAEQAHTDSDYVGHNDVENVENVESTADSKQTQDETASVFKAPNTIERNMLENLHSVHGQTPTSAIRVIPPPPRNIGVEIVARIRARNQAQATAGNEAFDAHRGLGHD